MSAIASPKAATSNPQVAVVGAGLRGTMFGQALSQNPGADLVAVCDPSERARDRAARQFGVSAYESVPEMLKSEPQLDAAVVATPDFAHRDAAVACLESGLDILLEKPLATTLDDADAIVAAEARSGARIMVGFENRWSPRFGVLKDAVSEASGSSIVSQVVNLNDAISVPTQMLSWASKSSPAWFLMPHTLDLAIWISGARPVSVFATSRSGHLASLGVDTLDSASATFEMDDGSYVVLNSSWCQPLTMPSIFDFRYELQTASDVFHVNGASQGVTRVGPSGIQWPQGASIDTAGRVRGVAVDMLDDFVRALRDEPGLDMPSAEEGLIVTRAIDAAHTSLRERAIVTI